VKPDRRESPAVRWRAEVEAIDSARQSATDVDARLAVQRQIVALHGELDAVRRAADEQLDALRAVAQSWKRDVNGRPVATTRRIDHLGASTFVEKGWARLAQGDADGALPPLARALEMTPDDRQLRAMHAWAMLLAGHEADALHELHGVLVRDSRHALARAVVGLAAQRAGRLVDASEHLHDAAAQTADPKASLYATYWLGVVYLQRDMATEAILQLSRALELGPNLLEAAWALGRAHWSRNERETAVAVWQRAAVSNRFSAWATRCADAAARAGRGEDPLDSAITSS
jgi:tetratricopeptide (TPR) repeat protein